MPTSAPTTRGATTLAPTTPGATTLGAPPVQAAPMTSTPITCTVETYCYDGAKSASYDGLHCTCICKDGYYGSKCQTKDKSIPDDAPGLTSSKCISGFDCVVFKKLETLLKETILVGSRGASYDKMPIAKQRVVVYGIFTQSLIILLLLGYILFRFA